MNELEGFVLYRPRNLGTYSAYISVSSKYIRISSLALESLGAPEYVLCFTDEKKRRLMIKKADKSMENIIQLRAVVNTKDTRRSAIWSKGLVEMCRKMGGISDQKVTVLFPGHAVGDVPGTMIFELSRPMEREK